VVATIQATIIQFNKVVICVRSFILGTTCLKEWSMDAADRAMVVKHWIKVAWTCCRSSQWHSLLFFLLSKAVFRFPA
jgi:ral guanine nucleotide dissociation stimulator